ncbi:sodium-dependent glucose transporter 1A-like [Antedon mediterranea]|uniref:sodium-dependent glucose transporter 1A-like n=1 Tax=Antedon mediterranea TaxID=105859 RepID=UPI003AF8B3B8
MSSSSLNELSEDECTKLEVQSDTSEVSHVEYVIKDFRDVVGKQNAEQNDQKWPKTIALFWGFISLGLIIGILGPTIPDLLYQVDASYGQLSYIFLSRGFGYMTGSIISGLLLERVNAYGLLGTFLVLCSVGSICVPVTHTLWTVLFAFVFIGTAMGGLDTGGNVLCLRIWERRSPPYMQALHFIFAVGASTAPLIAKPFISVFAVVTPTLGNVYNMTNTSFSGEKTTQSMQLTLTNVTEYILSLCSENEICNFTTSTIAIEGTENYTIENTASSTTMIPAIDFGEVEELGNIFIAYAIIATVTFLGSLTFFYFCFTGSFECKLRCRNSVNHAPLAEDAVIEHTDKWFRIQMLSILFVFYFLYVGGEVAFGSYIYSYAINCDLKLSKDQASLLNSLFWGSFAVFRGFAIFLAYVFTPLQMLMADVITCAGASIILSLLANVSIVGIWFGTALLGASMASLFPTGISWLERYIHVTGNDAAILVVGASFGEMVIPFVIGQYFPDDQTGDSSQNKKENINSLMYLMLIISCLTFGLFLLAYKLASKKGDRYSITRKEASEDMIETYT